MFKMYNGYVTILIALLFLNTSLSAQRSEHQIGFSAGYSLPFPGTWAFNSPEFDKIMPVGDTTTFENTSDSAMVKYGSGGFGNGLGLNLEYLYRNGSGLRIMGGIMYHMSGTQERDWRLLEMGASAQGTENTVIRSIYNHEELKGSYFAFEAGLGTEVKINREWSFAIDAIALLGMSSTEVVQHYTPRDIFWLGRMEINLESSLSIGSRFRLSTTYKVNDNLSFIGGVDLKFISFRSKSYTRKLYNPAGTLLSSFDYDLKDIERYGISEETEWVNQARIIPYYGIGITAGLFYTL